MYLWLEVPDVELLQGIGHLLGIPMVKVLLEELSSILLKGLQSHVGRGWGDNILLLQISELKQSIYRLLV